MPSKEELEELGVSKENYSYLQKLYNLNKKFMHLKEAQKGEPLTSFKKYIDRVVAVATYGYGVDDAKLTKKDLRVASRSLLRTKLYMDDAELFHMNAVSSIKKEKGLMSKLYRWGGATAFRKSSFLKESSTMDILGKPYKLNKGTYNFGGVYVRFWTYDGSGSEVGYIEMYTEDGSKHEFIAQIGGNDFED